MPPLVTCTRIISPLGFSLPTFFKVREEVRRDVMSFFPFTTCTEALGNCRRGHETTLKNPYNLSCYVRAFWNCGIKTEEFDNMDPNPFSTSLATQLQRRWKMSVLPSSWEYKNLKAFIPFILSLWHHPHPFWLITPTLLVTSSSKVFFFFFSGVTFKSFHSSLTFP